MISIMFVRKETINTNYNYELELTIYLKSSTKENIYKDKLF